VRGAWAWALVVYEPVMDFAPASTGFSIRTHRYRFARLRFALTQPWFPLCRFVSPWNTPHRTYKHTHSGPTLFWTLSAPLRGFLIARYATQGGAGDHVPHSGR